MLLTIWGLLRRTEWFSQLWEYLSVAGTRRTGLHWAMIQVWLAARFARETQNNRKVSSWQEVFYFVQTSLSEVYRFFYWNNYPADAGTQCPIKIVLTFICTCLSLPRVRFEPGVWYHPNLTERGGVWKTMRKSGNLVNTLMVSAVGTLQSRASWPYTCPSSRRNFSQNLHLSIKENSTIFKTSTWRKPGFFRSRIQ